MINAEKALVCLFMLQVNTICVYLHVHVYMVVGFSDCETWINTQACIIFLILYQIFHTRYTYSWSIGYTSCSWCSHVVYKRTWSTASTVWSLQLYCVCTTHCPTSGILIYTLDSFYVARICFMSDIIWSGYVCHHLLCLWDFSLSSHGESS